MYDLTVIQLMNWDTGRSVSRSKAVNIRHAEACVQDMSWILDTRPKHVLNTWLNQPITEGEWQARKAVR